MATLRYIGSEISTVEVNSTLTTKICDRPSGIYLLRALQVPSAKVRAFTEALKAHIGAPPRWG
jgi:hypothetical protein